MAAFLAAATACSQSSQTDGSVFHGVPLNSPLAMPSFSLVTTDGRAFDFARETDGKVALLFFGYTHCPDVCPLHMANIAAVLRTMPWEERSQIRVIFVTTDPERDTPARLSSWLANFDPSFIGLTGTPEAIGAAQRSLGLREAQRESLGQDSAGYGVGHAAQVFAFARDGLAYLVYPFGIRQEDWAHDLPLLARDARGDDTRRALAAARTTDVEQPSGTARRPVQPGGLAVTRAVVAGTWGAAPASSAVAYLSVQNDAAEDTLVAVATDIAVRAEIHETTGEGKMRGMAPSGAIPIPSHAVTPFAPGGRHIMLFDLRKPLAPGDSVTLYLSFVRLGGVTVKAPVVTYADVERVLR
jgi:cytochrome oxidase Cu insertion factor (SCO1/SenC/PrrC family)/copper(I)-binding protein